MKKVIIFGLVFFGFCFFTLFGGNAWGLCQASISLPDTCVGVNDFILYPIYVSDLTNLGVYSFEFTLNFDTTALEAIYVTNTNTLSKDWEAFFYNIQGGKLLVATAGTEPLSGEGVLIYIGFQVRKGATLQFESFKFNDGSPTVGYDVGNITICQNYKIGGTVRYFGLPTFVPQTKMSISGGANAFTFTDEWGNYLFSQLVNGLDYIVKPEKTGDFHNSISAYDAALILRYVVDLIPLLPYQKIAADVNGNCQITAFDASFILRFVVGKISEFPCGKEWRFVPDYFALNDNNWCDALDSIFYPSLPEDKLNEDYHGIVMGDVSLNWMPFVTEKRSVFSRTISVSIPELVGYGGQLIDVPIKIDNPISTLDSVYSVEFAISFKGSILLPKDTCLITEGTLLSGWLAFANSLTDTVKVAASGSSPLSGQGILAILRFTIPSIQEKDSTILHFANFMFNEGNPFVSTLDGFLKVFPSTGVEDEKNPNLPNSFELFQNYPNPFNPETKISYNLAKGTNVWLAVYNLKGELVRTLVNSYQSAGLKSVIWDGRDYSGIKVCSGVYFYKLNAGENSFTKKMVLLK